MNIKGIVMKIEFDKYINKPDIKINDKSQKMAITLEFTMFKKFKQANGIIRKTPQLLMKNEKGNKSLKAKL